MPLKEREDITMARTIVTCTVCGVDCHIYSKAVARHFFHGTKLCPGSEGPLSPSAAETLAMVNRGIEDAKGFLAKLEQSKSALLIGNIYAMPLPEPVKGRKDYLSDLPPAMDVKPAEAAE